MKACVLLLAALAAAPVFAADQVPLFNATLSVGKEHRFVLVDSAGKASAFLRLGEAFDGYVLKAYDAKSGVLDLERNGKTTRVTLISDAATASAPVATPATLADAAAVLDKMRFEEMMTRSLDRQKKMVASQFEQMAARLNTPGVDKEAFTAFRKKLMDEVMSVMDVQQMKTDVTRIYSEVFTKEELQGLSAFYSTPLGEVLASKQPEVQDRLGAVVSARMVDIMPKVQQMAREFAQQQQQARNSAGAAAPAAPAAAGGKP